MRKVVEGISIFVDFLIRVSLNKRREIFSREYNEKGEQLVKFKNTSVLKIGIESMKFPINVPGIPKRITKVHI